MAKGVHRQEIEMWSRYYFVHYSNCCCSLATIVYSLIVPGWLNGELRSTKCKLAGFNRPWFSHVRKCASKVIYIYIYIYIYSVSNTWNPTALNGYIYGKCVTCYCSEILCAATAGEKDQVWGRERNHMHPQSN